MWALVSALATACVNMDAFETVTIIASDATRASALAATLCPHASVTTVRGVLPQNTGCPNAIGVHGCYAAHLNAWTRVFSARATGWHIIFEDDAVPGNYVRYNPGWFESATKGAGGASVVNLGPNDIYPDWSRVCTHFITQLADVLRYAFGGRLPTLPGFGTLTHAYAVTNAGAGLLAGALSEKRCGAAGVDTDMRDLREPHPGFFARVYARGDTRPPNATRFWGLFGQSVHACGTCARAE